MRFRTLSIKSISVRIFSVFILIPWLLTGIYPLVGQENQNINTKTKMEIENQTDFFLNKNQNAPFYFEGYEPLKVKSETEIQRELVVYRRGKKQNFSAADLFGKKLLINASAYTAAADECGKSDGITASGVKVQENRTLACPPQYPFGTKIKIKGYGTYICEDRGGAIKGNKFDIYMETKKQAFAFGRRNLEAEVVF